MLLIISKQCQIQLPIYDMSRVVILGVRRLSGRLNGRASGPNHYVRYELDLEYIHIYLNILEYSLIRQAGRFIGRNGWTYLNQFRFMHEFQNLVVAFLVSLPF
jgi:hypothetical protein